MNQEKYRQGAAPNKNPNTLYLLIHLLVFTLAFTIIFIIMLFWIAHTFIGHTGKQIVSAIEISRIYSIKNQKPNIPLNNIFILQNLPNSSNKYYFYSGNEILGGLKQFNNQLQVPQQNVQKILDQSFYGLTQKIQKTLNKKHTLTQSNNSFYNDYNSFIED